MKIGTIIILTKNTTSVTSSSFAPGIPVARDWATLHTTQLTLFPKFCIHQCGYGYTGTRPTTKRMYPTEFLWHVYTRIVGYQALQWLIRCSFLQVLVRSRWQPHEIAPSTLHATLPLSCEPLYTGRQRREVFK